MTSSQVQIIEEEHPSVIKKWVIRILALFFVVLIISLTFFDAIVGIVQSQTLKDNKLVFQNATIIFQNNTLSQLQSEFLQNQHREIKACLFGMQEQGVYYIGRIEFPQVLRANVIHIVSVQCPKTTLIDLHSHPLNECLASKQDISTLSELRKENPKLKMMVMCAQNRFSFT